jgi:ATP-binding cassette, subfamily B, multidrug efflux pump
MYYAVGRETEKYTLKKLLGGADVLIRVARMTLHYPGRMLLAMAASLVAVIFQLYIPRFLGDAVNNAYGLLTAGTSMEQARRALLVTGVLLFGASVLRGLFTMLHNYMGESVGQRIGYELRMAVYDKIQRLDFRFHDHAHSGDLITRGMLDVEGLRLFVNTGLLRLIILTMLIGVAAYKLFTANVVLAAMALSFVPFVGWRAVDARLTLRVSWHKLQERLSMLTRIIEENLQGIRVVRAFAARDHEMEKFDKASDEAKELTYERIGTRVRNGTVMTLAFFISMGLVLLVGGQKTLNGEITIGRLAEFLAYMTILQMPVRQLGMLVNALARAMTSGERLFAILDEEPDILDKPHAEDLRVEKGILRFEDVSFAYKMGDEEVHVLSGLDFEVGPGQVLGIVGPPGSGKTTVAHLIPRFYDVTSGRITIDGQDIRDVTLKSLRNTVSVIQQDNFLFTAGIENNIAYGNPWADRDRIAGAANAAQLHDYVRNLPRGYRTMVGERGVSLSGGQRQRLVIARTLVLQPSIMVLDDSTAAVDAATEQRIQSALAEMSWDRAVIVIAHRLSALMHADEILFLDEGRVIERGNHAQLLAAGGRYKALYDLQSNPLEEGLHA